MSVLKVKFHIELKNSNTCLHSNKVSIQVHDN